MCLHCPLLAKLLWFTCYKFAFHSQSICFTPETWSYLIWLFPQLLQGNGSPARPCVLGRGHSLRHLRGGGETAQQCVAHTVDGRRLRWRGKHRPVPHAKHNQTPQFYFMLVPCIAPELMTILLLEEIGLVARGWGRHWWLELRDAPDRRHSLASGYSMSFNAVVQTRNSRGTWWFQGKFVLGTPDQHKFLNNFSKEIWISREGTPSY